jgi:hypothetical protein
MRHALGADSEPPSQPQWIRPIRGRRCYHITPLSVVEGSTMDIIVTREAIATNTVVIWIGPEQQGPVHAHRESCWRQPHSPVDQYAFGALLLRPDGLMAYCIPSSSIQSLLGDGCLVFFRSRLYPSFDSFPYLGTQLFLSMPGVIYSRPVVAIWVILPTLYQ